MIVTLGVKEESCRINEEKLFQDHQVDLGIVNIHQMAEMRVDQMLRCLDHGKHLDIKKTLVLNTNAILSDVSLVPL